MAVAAILRGEVAAMNVNNFVVRPKRRFVEKYARPEEWTALSAQSLAEIAREVAGLPSQLDPEAEEAKRFDLLILHLQLALLRTEPGFERMRDKVRAIAGLLQEKEAIPMIREQMALILDVQTDEWWQDVTTPLLETVQAAPAVPRPVHREDAAAARLHQLRGRDGRRRRASTCRASPTPPASSGSAPRPGRSCAQHQDHMAIHKVRTNRPLTAADLAELERVLAEVGAPEDIERAKSSSQGPRPLRPLAGRPRP